MRLAEWLKYVEEQEQKQIQDEPASPEKVSGVQEESAGAAPKNGNGAVAPQAPAARGASNPSVRQVESIEKPAQASLFQSPPQPADANRARRLVDDNSLEIPDIEDFLPFLKPAGKPDVEGNVEDLQGTLAETKEASPALQNGPVPEAAPARPSESDVLEEEKPVSRAFRPVPPLFSLPADAGAPEEPIAQERPVQEVVDEAARAEAVQNEKAEEAISTAESDAVSTGRTEDATAAGHRDGTAATDTTALESLPRHIQALGRLDAGAEIAQNSYKRNFTESRSELIQRLLDPPISLEDAARILNVCPTTVRRYTNKGLLPHFRTAGNQRRFRLSDVISFMESQGQRAGRGRPRKRTGEAEGQAGNQSVLM